MRKESFRKALVGLATLIGGCSLIENPDGFRVGIMARHAQGRSNVFNEKMDVFLNELSTEKRLDDRFDFSLNLGFAHNETDLKYGLEGSTKGKMYSLGGQVSYYPFYNGRFNFDKKRRLSIDIGGEMVMADVDLKAKVLGFEYKFSDDITAWGINFGGTCRFPLTKKKGFFISGGYMFNDNESERGNYDGDGPYAKAGMYFRF